MQYFYQQVATPNSQPAKRCKTLQGHSFFTGSRSERWHSTAALHRTWPHLLNYQFYILFSICLLEKNKMQQEQGTTLVSQQDKAAAVTSCVACMCSLCTQLFAHQKFPPSDVYFSRSGYTTKAAVHRAQQVRRCSESSAH